MDARMYKKFKQAISNIIMINGEIAPGNKQIV